MSKTAKFRTVGGNYVTFKPKDGLATVYCYGSWECGGCGESHDHAKRDTANEHAATCRAI
ncbi:hypothetical protein AB0B89_29200 [Sphaerisporangium sp. NPDC049002]|uniref:hypothetical protein n=1 Tax=Sphaerisporangium sp. NPDC049002 TaxID=3155392 RepID=UPI0033C02022